MNVRRAEYFSIFIFPIADIIFALFRFVFIALILNNQLLLVLLLKYLPLRF